MFNILILIDFHLKIYWTNKNKNRNIAYVWKKEHSKKLNHFFDIAHARVCLKYDKYKFIRIRNLLLQKKKKERKILDIKLADIEKYNITNLLWKKNTFKDIRKMAEIGER